MRLSQKQLYEKRVWYKWLKNHAKLTEYNENTRAKPRIYNVDMYSK